MTVEATAGCIQTAIWADRRQTRLGRTWLLVAPVALMIDRIVIVSGSDIAVDRARGLIHLMTDGRMARVLSEGGDVRETQARFDSLEIDSPLVAVRGGPGTMVRRDARLTVRFDGPQRRGGV